GRQRLGSPSMLIMTPGVPSADAKWDVPVQLERMALACLISTANAPSDVFPATTTGVLRIYSTTCSTMGISSCVPVMTTRYPDSAHRSARLAKAGGGHCRQVARLPG